MIPHRSLAFSINTIKKKCKLIYPLVYCFVHENNRGIELVQAHETSCEQVSFLHRRSRELALITRTISEQPCLSMMSFASSASGQCSTRVVGVVGVVGSTHLIPKRDDPRRSSLL